MTFGQTLRINVSAGASESCVAQLGFRDSGGNQSGPSSRISLKPGESAFLELPSSAVAAKRGQRVEVRPRLVPDPSTMSSACQTSVSVLRLTPAEPGTQEEAKARPAGGTPEAIKVHGH